MHNLFSALIETVYICSQCFTSWNTFAYSRSISLPIADRCSLINGVTYFSEFAFYDAHLQAEYQSVSQESLGKYAQSVKNKSLQRVQPCKLDLCIQSFLKASLDTEEMQDCDVCGGEKPHFRQTFVREVGEELVFHMKRNSVSEPGTPINCPDMLDMGEYVGGGGKYSLSAVVSLNGSVESGNYSTYIKRGERWMLLEGQATRAVSLGSNVLQSPYLLFYSQLA
jgi:ubiquitin C-terminal hydrolase